MADSSPFFRNMILDNGGLIKIMKSTENNSFLEIEVWAVSALCYGYVNYELVKDAIPWFAKLVLAEESQEILESAIWSLACLSGSFYFQNDDNSQRTCQYLIKSGCYKKLVSLLRYFS